MNDPIPEPGYRYLQKGETLMEGDEYDKRVGKVLSDLINQNTLLWQHLESSSKLKEDN